MKVIRFSDTEKIEHDHGIIHDYPISKDIGISYQKLNGRGPEKGMYLNKVCHEIYVIVSGTAVFHSKDKKFEVSAKDVVVVEPCIAHFIEAQNLEYFAITRPDWYEGQYEEVEI